MISLRDEWLSWANALVRRSATRSRLDGKTRWGKPGALLRFDARRLAGPLSAALLR
jgi:hypothetical protein